MVADRVVPSKNVDLAMISTPYWEPFPYGSEFGVGETAFVEPPTGFATLPGVVLTGRTSEPPALTLAEGAVDELIGTDEATGGVELVTVGARLSEATAGELTAICDEGLASTAVLPLTTLPTTTIPTTPTTAAAITPQNRLELALAPGRSAAEKVRLTTNDPAVV